jgi:hypothetical protein
MKAAPWRLWAARCLFPRTPGQARSPQKVPRVCLETLEDRLLPAGATPTYLVDHQAVQPAYASAPVGLTAAEVRAAYGINQVSLGGVAGNGAGQTIAIIDAYDDPQFVDSTSANFVNSDLHQFDLAMGLPDPPSFRKVAQDGSNNYPQQNAGWDGEIALDVEWAHALAPEANIVLVEANSSSYSDLIAGAVNWARQQPGVSVVTMSFGGGEFAGESSLDGYFTTPAGHNGVTFVASTGDSGAPGGYPAFSPNVLAVGGTTLSVGSGGSYAGESAWSDGGGGLSTQEGQPAYQHGVVTQSSTQRAIPDVSFDADPTSGVAVYDTVNNSASAPWWQVGGTSLAAPAWAALIAITDQLRVASGQSTLDGPSQTLPAIYKLPASDFHDITTGSNGYAAGPGYDLATGRGSPIANRLIPDLAGVSSSAPAAGYTAIEVPGAGVSLYSSATGWQSLTGTDASLLAADAAGDVAGAFPGCGVYEHTAAGGWQRLTTATPLMLAMDGSGDVFGGFSSGVWEYTGGSWVQLTSALPSQLSVNAAGEVLGVFSSGLWRDTPGVGWKQLSAPAAAAGVTASLAGIDAAGDVFAEFPSKGLWEDTAAGWRQISSSDASLLAVDAAGDAAADFPTAGGVWFYTAATHSLSQLMTTNASRLTTDAAGDVVAEFPGAGVQVYTKASGWKQLTTANASLVAGSAGGDTDAGDDIVSVVPGSGVWRYTDAAGWQQLTAASATLAASDLAGDVVAQVGGAIWRWRDATGWAQLATATASQLALDAAGDVYAAVPGEGVWRYTDAAGWQQLSGSNASVLAVDAGGDAVVDLTTGVWRYTNGAGWQQLTSGAAALLTIDAAGDVVGSFTHQGVWRYTNAGGWQQLTTADASQLAVDAAGDITGAFASLGVERYTATGGWQQLSPADAAFVVMSATGEVVAQYGGSTLYRYFLQSVTGESFSAMIASVLAMDSGAPSTAG